MSRDSPFLLKYGNAYANAYTYTYTYRYCEHRVRV
jgi:hypothetical protein